MKIEDKIYFEVFYHPNQFTSTFKYAFESLDQAKDLIHKEFPGFVLVDEKNIKYPYVIVSNKKYTQGEIISLFFGKIKN